MKLARTDRERVRATTFRANYTPSPDIIRDISIEKTKEKNRFKLRLEGRSRVGRTDEDRERVPQGADAHEVGVAKGRGPRWKETKVKTGRTTTRTRRGKLDKQQQQQQQVYFNLKINSSCLSLRKLKLFSPSRLGVAFAVDGGSPANCMELC